MYMHLSYKSSTGFSIVSEISAALHNHDSLFYFPMSFVRRNYINVYAPILQILYWLLRPFYSKTSKEFHY